MNKTAILSRFVKKTCVDEKAFYEKLELLKDKSNCNVTVYIDQSF